MELAQQYINSRSQQIKHIEEDFGECREMLYNAHMINKLRVRAKDGTAKVYMDGRMLLEGEDFHLTHNNRGSFIQFIGYDSSTLRGSLIEVLYHGFESKGDGSIWN